MTIRFLILICLVLNACGASPNITEENEPGLGDTMDVKDGWSVSGYLATGGVVISTPNGSLSQNAISLQGTFAEEEGGLGAQYYTVQFNVLPPPHGLFYAYADVTWSVMGNATTRRISMADGAVISGTAQFVKVNMFDMTPLALISARALVPEVYYVDACITRGTRPSTQQPPRLIPFVFPGQSIVPSVATSVPGFYVIAPTLTEQIPIDQTAGIISVFIEGIGANRQLAPGDATVFFAISGLGISNVDMKDIIGEWLPVPPGTNLLGIQNNSNTDDLLATIQFGIEG